MVGAGGPGRGAEEAAFVDDLAGAGVLGGAGEGADRTAEEAGVVVHVVQFAEAEFQGVEEPPMECGAAGGGRGGGRGAGAVGEAQGVVEAEGAPPQGAVFVEELVGGAFGPGGVVGVRVRAAGASYAVAGARRRAVVVSRTSGPMRMKGPVTVVGGCQHWVCPQLRAPGGLARDRKETHGMDGADVQRLTAHYADALPGTASCRRSPPAWRSARLPGRSF
ncbi:hypothetical protein [Streptomyces niveiscabiei]|uniref:hypothetical protein n=1 Tax=Streptomyces niveiscabiei TaxID=164115 RepID=UPI0029CA2713|nr:hypothetical protein [Streptomyces niveiscabiei]